MEVADVRRSIDRVRAAIAWLSLGAFVVCAGVVWLAYRLREDAEHLAELEQPSIEETILQVVGFYLPVLLSVAAFLWAAEPLERRAVAPQGEAMAKLRDRFTVAVFGVALVLPILLYFAARDIGLANRAMQVYQTAAMSLLGGGLAFYFGSPKGSSSSAEQGEPEGASDTSEVADSEEVDSDPSD